MNRADPVERHEVEEVVGRVGGVDGHRVTGLDAPVVEPGGPCPYEFDESGTRVGEPITRAAA